MFSNFISQYCLVCICAYRQRVGLRGKRAHVDTVLAGGKGTYLLGESCLTREVVFNSTTGLKSSTAVNLFKQQIHSLV